MFGASSEHSKAFDGGAPVAWGFLHKDIVLKMKEGLVTLGLQVNTARHLRLGLQLSGACFTRIYSIAKEGGACCLGLQVNTARHLRVGLQLWT